MEVGLLKAEYQNTGVSSQKMEDGNRIFFW